MSDFEVHLVGTGKLIEAKDAEIARLQHHNSDLAELGLKLQEQNKKLQAVVDANQDREILRAFFEAVCDDNWEVANGIRAALMPVEALGDLEESGNNDLRQPSPLKTVDTFTSDTTAALKEGE